MRRLTLAALAATAALATAAEAQNQPAERPTLRPPQPTRAEGVPILSYGAVLIVMVSPLLVNFITSKRGHQD